jgi:hypothetical protein
VEIVYHDQPPVLPQPASTANQELLYLLS